MCVSAEHLLAQHSSIKMLHNRIKIILAYIQAAQKGWCSFLYGVCVSVGHCLSDWYERVATVIERFKDSALDLETILENFY